MIADYPRALIIGQSFDQLTGPGITLTNLFHDWPADKIALAYQGDHLPDTTVCQQFYRLGSLEDYWVWPLSYIKRQGKLSGPVELSPSSQQYHESRERLRVTDDKRVSRELFYLFVSSSGTNELLRRLRLSPGFLSWVRHFEPEVIYTQLASLNLMRFVANLTKCVKASLAIQFMDDWPSVLYRRNGLLSPYLRWRTDRELRALLRQAAILFGHYPGMCEAFQVRYGQTFQPFHNSIDLAKWIPISKKDWVAHIPFRLMYAGRIGRATSASLLDICQCVSDLRQLGVMLVFDVYSPDYGSSHACAMSRFDGTHIHEVIPYEEIPMTMAQADLLILPFDFDSETRSFARYSMSTKMADYMASGVPTLIYAPSDFSVSMYARQEGWGYLVSKNDPILLKDSIRRLIQDPIFCAQLGRRAMEIAAKNHDSNKVRGAFRQALADVADHQNSR